MLFNSFQFLIFYLIAALVFFAIPHRWRWAFLLVASYYFYMCWNPAYVVIIWAITLIDYGVGIRIEETEDPRWRKLWLLLSLAGNFGILFLFKYTDFLFGSLRGGLRAVNFFADIPQLGWLLPVGISFHTFQAVSYTVEVYRRRSPAERHLGLYALYVAFFPQMVAGPIERPYNLLPQFHRRTRLEYIRLRSGLELILWGLYKKMIVADSIAALVNRVYERPRQFSGALLSIATVCFAIQIYCDFSGYSDMAIGLARIMGYDLMINFRRPYFAGSIADFWRRWHISLSSWFRDYVYIPLGGNRADPLRWVCNVMAVFLLSGLWHGANWTFVIWGGVHGLYLVFGRALARVRETLAEWSGVARWPALRRVSASLTTCALVCFAWIFFRAKSVGDALYVATHFFRPGGFHWRDLLAVGMPAFELQITVLAIAVLFLVEFLQTRPSPWLIRSWESRRVRWPVYCAAFYSLVFFGVFDRIEFIYFQF